MPCYRFSVGCLQHPYYFINFILIFFSVSSVKSSIENKIIVKVGNEIVTLVELENKINTSLILSNQNITQTQYLPALRKELPFLNFAPILFISAKSGYNIKRSIEAIDYVAAQTRTEISTGILNRVIQLAIENLPPPITKGKRLKIYYATQSGSNPIYFKLFVNNPDLSRSNWIAYLKNRLRDKFGLEGAPIFIKLIPRTRE